MKQNYVIQTRNLVKVYGEQVAVSKINLNVRRGTIYGLLGRNGAGKTTAMKMLLALTTPDQGAIRIFGRDPFKDGEALFPRIGSLIESPGFYPNLTGTENLKIFATLRGIPKLSAVKDALELVGLPYRDKKLFSQYSLGMKQRLAIALAVMHDPELLILDEPINGLDPIGIAEIRDLFRQFTAQGKTLLISSHILSEMALIADDVGIIHEGSLLEEESMETLRTKNKMYIRLAVSDAARTARILTQIFKTEDFSVESGTVLRLFDTNIPVRDITRCLVANDVAVDDAHLQEDTLEDYFRKVTGGVGIA